MLSPINDVIAAISHGEAVIMVDDDDRENEGDIVVAADAVTSEQISLMLSAARGLICVTLTPDRVKALNLFPQVQHNQSPFQTAFTISVDAHEVQGSGMTAASRAFTIQRLSAATSTSKDFVSPGCIFPLRAHPQGVLGRRGQTEGSVDLCRIAGRTPAGVICEILNKDGSMARGAEIVAFARMHGLLITSVESIAQYRREIEVHAEKVAERVVKTAFGDLRTIVFDDVAQGKEHMAFCCGDLKNNPTPLVRIHSECLTGDIFGSRRCDCGPQLFSSLEAIQNAGSGIVIYLRQEGRGIGLSNKLKAYALQDQGSDTVEANQLLGFEPDERNFQIAARILTSLGVTSIRLMTNNPQKLQTIQKGGISVVERIPVIVPFDECSQAYLLAKKQKLGHLL